MIDHALGNAILDDVKFTRSKKGVVIRTGLPSIRWREFEPLRSQLNAQHRAAIRDLFEPL